jgi:hypothetical protein
MRREAKTHRFITPFVEKGRQFSLHLDQKYECLDLPQNEARKGSACVPSLHSSAYVGKGVRGPFPDCSKHVYQRTIYPEPQSDDSNVKWKSREKTERVLSVIYADFESCLIPVHDHSGVLDEHVPSGFCVYTVSADLEFETGPVTYSSRDCMTVSYDHLVSEQR